MGRWGCLSLVVEVGRTRHGGPLAAGYHVVGHHGDRCRRGHFDCHGDCCCSDVKMTDRHRV
jgi:hypothetical protein